MSDERKWHARSRNTALTRKDLEDFTEIVRARHPSLYIQETTIVPGTLTVLDHFGQMHSDCVACPYRPDPAPHVTKSLENGVWMPEFHNRPQIFVEIYQKDIETFDLRTIEADGARRPVDAVVRRLPWNGFIRGSWQEGSEERRKFVQSFFYLAGRFMTNDFDAYDVASGKKLATYRKCTFWAGPDAMRLGETDRDFYCVVYFDREFDTWVGYKAIPRERKK